MLKVIKSARVFSYKDSSLLVHGNRQVISSETWEPALLILKQSSYEIKLISTGEVAVSEKFSKELSVCPRNWCTHAPNSYVIQYVLCWYIGSNILRSWSFFVVADQSSMRVLNAIRFNMLWWILPSFKHIQCPVRHCSILVMTGIDARLLFLQ